MLWSTVGGSRSVRGLWHVCHSCARAVAMVITALAVSPIQGVQAMRGGLLASLSRVHEVCRPSWKLS